MAEPSGIRCSDAERDEARRHLAEAAGEGRLTVAETEERLTRVASARYRDELAEVTADLPPRAVPGPSAGWGPVFGAVRRQIGGSGTVADRRRRLVVTLAVLLLAAALLLAVWHGFGDDGFDHHGPDRG